MRRWWLTGAGLIPAMLAAQTAAPPPQSAAPPSDVVVVGQQGRDRGQEVRDYVSALAGVGGTDPLGRFDRAPVCPAVVGLDQSFTTAIAARMRRIAQAAGIATAPAGCRPNALVLVTTDKRQMIAALRKTHPAYFRDVMQQEIRVPDQPGPATAWQLGARIDRQGVAVEGSPNTSLRSDQPQTITPPMGASRIGVNLRPVFVAAVVVIELKALDGLTTTQIGDYAAMRAFADIDPARLKRVTAPTILTVLDAPMDSEVPLTLTQWDLSYLRGLYAAPAFNGARSQRAGIGRTIGRELDGKAP